MRINPFLYLALLTISMLAGCQSYGSQLDPSDSSITEPLLHEISGIASSNLLTDHLWLINDSGNSPTLYLVDKNFDIKKSVDLTARNRDWEDLSAFVFEGISWIVVAETGDNLKKHTSSFLYFFLEEELLKSDHKNLTPEKTLEFTYSDGPQNCEAIAVDTLSRKILLLNKSETVSSLYELPLFPEKKEKKQIAKRTTELKVFPGHESASLIKVLTGVNPDAITGMDVKKDGSSAFVLTYRDIWQFVKNPDSSWAKTFSQSATHFSSIKLRQAEAIAVSTNDATILVTTEGIPAPVLSFRN